MMRVRTTTHRRFRSAVLLVAAVFAAIAFGDSMLRAQAPPAQARVVRLQQGRPFHGDLRQLPDRLPPQRERRPVENEREEPSLPRGVGDSSAQISAPMAPAPAPGTGGGAGSFAGLDFAHWGDGWPPDTNGDVGPTYYIQTVNTSVGIFRKSDGIQVAAFSFDTLMGQGNLGNSCDNQNFGDPVVVWDAGADRWIISNFAFATNAGNPVPPYYECFAVSKTGDPVNGGWNFYALPTTDLFPDYPKLGVWPDALYLTANMFSGNTFKNVRAWALDKTAMYAGAPATAVSFNLPAKVQGVSVFTGIPSTYHTATGAPPAGRPNFISVIWSAHVARVWKFHVDFSNTANSTLTGPSSVTLASWGVGPTSVPAKSGNALDSLRERLMVQNQYTNRAGVESLWLTHTVANPGNAALASPRWYQLAVTGGNVASSPVQQSTWAPDSTVARWMPSLAVDKDGNMAIGYSVASSTLFPGIRYAGRLATDPANTLGQTETSLIEGTASQCCNFSDGTVNNRWGDYSAMTIDPDGCTFWYTTEYYQSPQPVSLAADNWQTRVGSFKFASCTPNAAALQGSVTSSATGNPIAGATVTIGTSSTTTDGAGQYTIGGLSPGTFNATASAAGYNNSTVSVTILAGVTTTQNFSLVPATGASTSLAVAAASGTFGGTTTLSATLTSSGTGVAGKSISFTLNGNAAGSASTDGSGVATLSNVSLAGVGGGTYPSGVGASFAGDGSYAGSSGTNSLDVAKASQTITFGALAAKTYGDPSFPVSATASSGLVVGFGASGNCTIATTTVTITGAGSCTITASQAGDANYLPAANVPQTFSIAKASQTITFGALAAKTYGDPSFAVSATASSGLAVSFGASGNCTIATTTVTITGAGSCTITASQGGNANYLAAPNVPQSFNIAKASQTITFGALAAKTYGDPSFPVSATASSGLVVSFGASGNCTIATTTVTITGAGSCTITASQAGDANYLAAANVPQTFNIAKAGQTIAFGVLAAKTYGDPSFPVSATASSGLVVSFGASGNCTIATTTVTITGAGSCTITASQGGNANYLAAPNVPQSFNIAKASQTITFGALAAKTYGDPSFPVSATASSGLVVSFGASGNCTIATTTVTITGAGSCTITASQAGDANYSPATNVPQTFSIGKASQLITFNPLPDKTTSDPPFTLSATASSGLPVGFSASGSCTVSGTTVTITGTGTCTITASQPGNINYNAALDVPRTFNITAGGGGGGTSATFVGIDSATQGSWSAVYGGDGFNVVNDLTSYPPYAVVVPSGQGSYTWLASTSDVRALQKASNPADRIAATWYGNTFSVDLNLTDGNTHQVGFYLVDWDSTSRTETLEVHDAATDALLDSRTIGGFHNGQYVVWNLRGHVTVRVVANAGVNAVVSGLFFGGSAPPPNPTASAAFVGIDATTGGSWLGVYGSDGYNVISDAVSYPAYAQVGASGQFSYTWAPTTSDVRALQKASNPADRLAATWYGLTFNIDVNLVDGLTHRVALYMVDWDGTSRVQSIEVRDAVTNALLDARSVSGFHDGRYAVWNVTGHVTMRVTISAGVNAVISGLFFGP